MISVKIKWFLSSYLIKTKLWTLCAFHVQTVSKEKLVKSQNVIKKTNTVGNTVLAQSVSHNIPLQESDHFAIEHRPRYILM